MLLLELKFVYFLVLLAAFWSICYNGELEEHVGSLKVVLPVFVSCLLQHLLQWRVTIEVCIA